MSSAVERLQRRLNTVEHGLAALLYALHHNTPQTFDEYQVRELAKSTGLMVQNRGPQGLHFVLSTDEATSEVAK